MLDALGRLVRVDEPDVNGNLGAVDATLPNQQTHYEYDGNDNLVKVIQSDGTVTQERKFKYDSLSRLTHEQQIEADPTLDIDGIKGTADPSKWTKFLKYDLDGRLDFAVDAKGVKTTFGYDGLNRIKTVSYTGETGYITPNLLYTYDQARSQAFNTGGLTRVETAAVGDAPATATEFDYDLMGRVKKHRQYIGTQEYPMEYGYNLAGQLTTQKYPSGRVVTNSFDANGRLAGVSDGSRTYLSGLQYEGKGGSVSQASLGNGTTQTIGLNDRFQLLEQELKKGSEVLQKYGYTYGELDSQSILRNNGKLETVTSHIGATKQWTQKFTNDHIGRLKETQERRGDTSAVSYKQTFDYDRFGNMYRKATSNPTTGQENPLPYTPIEDTDIDKSTNRFTVDTSYDVAGNVVTDDKFRSMDFVYDANGRVVKASRDQVPDALSVYDASGMRVAEKVNDVWRFMAYDVGGKVICEYGGLQSTDEGGVKYVLQDWQGSTRAVVGNTGNVQSRSDYTAFGEKVDSSAGLRSSTQGFGKSSSVRQGYALTEKDDATGLDHTWFRKNENQAGRWTSPDPYNGSMSIGNPQSFNRYSYVENEPTNFVDPSGLQLRSYDVRMGLSCVLTDIIDGRNIWSCTELINRYWYDDGTGYDGGYGGDFDGDGGGANQPSRLTGDRWSLSDCAKGLLKKFFPNLNLDQVALQLGLPNWLPNDSTTSGQSIGGITLGNTIYTSSQSNFETAYGATWEALEFLAHEITHVDQYRRLGIVGFGIAYGVEGFFQAMIAPASEALAASYDSNAFETRATNNAGRIIKQLKREGASPCIVDTGNIATVEVRP